MQSFACYGKENIAFQWKFNFCQTLSYYSTLHCVRGNISVRGNSIVTKVPLM